MFLHHIIGMFITIVVQIDCILQLIMLIQLIVSLNAWLHMFGLMRMTHCMIAYSTNFRTFSLSPLFLVVLLPLTFIKFFLKLLFEFIKAVNFIFLHQCLIIRRVIRSLWLGLSYCFENLSFIPFANLKESWFAILLLFLLRLLVGFHCCCLRFNYKLSWIKV
jgi:hypothetical protein